MGEERRVRASVHAPRGAYAPPPPPPPHTHTHSPSSTRLMHPTAVRSVLPSPPAASARAAASSAVSTSARSWGVPTGEPREPTRPRGCWEAEAAGAWGVCVRVWGACGQGEECGECGSARTHGGQSARPPHSLGPPPPTHARTRPHEEPVSRGGGGSHRGRSLGDRGAGLAAYPPPPRSVRPREGGGGRGGAVSASAPMRALRGARVRHAGPTHPTHMPPAHPLTNPTRPPSEPARTAPPP